MEPKNRDRRPLVRGCWRWRTTISQRMPTRPPQANSSVSHSNGGKCPISGRTNELSNSWPTALTRVRKRIPNDTIVNQCATATTGRRAIRVWPRNSRTRVTVRATGASVRASGWPIRTVRVIWAIARANSEMATTMTARQTTVTAIRIVLLGFGSSACPSR